ncbi:Arc-like DNA binding domain protein [Rhizobium leguminosarum bv. trifolii WSM2012]|nr:Arc-like DNA binding domain protein [Rhizobium leguminosarum bv. trifolii WSM2012]
MNGESEEVRLTLRMPAALRDQLTEGAAKVGRSLNAEIVARLENSENVSGFLEDFQRAKERILHQQELAKSSDQMIEMLKTALDRERATNEQLLQMLKKKE